MSGQSNPSASGELGAPRDGEYAAVDNFDVVHGVLLRCRAEGVTQAEAARDVLRALGLPLANAGGEQ